MLFQRSSIGEFVDIALLVGLEKSECFALDEAFYDPCWVATREILVMKSFSSFEMSFNVDIKLCILLFAFLSV